MIQTIAEWFIRNWVEILGTLLGVIYVFLSIQQNILTWLTGLLTSLLYIYVFFVAKFYADMGLQVYYVWVSIYGWWLWSKGMETKKGHTTMPVSRIKQQQALTLTSISLLLWAGIYFILKYFTDSTVPFGDAFTTALSIVATWMLARKIIEHWIIWIVVDFVSLVLYVYKGLYPTSIMFIVYTGAAIWGYYTWNKQVLKTNE
ncbi:MAG: nicotinamide riboside transporter PnuC [Prolixibacteraceae bacterium]